MRGDIFERHRVILPLKFLRNRWQYGDKAQIDKSGKKQLWVSSQIVNRCIVEISILSEHHVPVDLVWRISSNFNVTFSPLEFYALFILWSFVNWELVDYQFAWVIFIAICSEWNKAVKTISDLLFIVEAD